MDPFTISASILAVASVTSSVFGLAQAVFKAFKEDDRFSTVYYTLLVEKQKTLGWVNNMRLVPGDDLCTKVPRENLRAVMDIIGKLESTYDRTNRKFHAVKPTGGDKYGPKNIRARALWVAGGYEELMLMLSLLRSLNEALNIMAPILPIYTPGTGPLEGRSAPPTSASAPDVETRPPEPSATQPPPAVGESSSQSSSSQITVRTIYRICLRGLYILGCLSNDLGESSQAASLRLRLWGTGLFEDPLSLDQIFESNRKRFEPMRMFLLRILVNIAVTEEHIFRRLKSDQKEIERREVADMQMKLKELLGSDEVVYMALEKWQSLLEDEQEGQDLTKCNQFNISALEILFDVLPSIRSIRREHVLLLEAREKPQPEAITTDIPSDTEHLVADNLDAVRGIEKRLHKQEEEARRQGKRIPLYSPLFQKERERMEEWELAASEDKQRAKQSREVGKMQAELSRAFGSFSAATQQAEKPMTALAFKASKAEKRPEGFTDAPIPVGELDNLLELCGTTTSHLFNVSQG